MKSKTSTVGGSPITGIGKDFSQFLQGGLSSGNFGNNAISQTQGFGGAINQLLGGHIGDPTSLQGYMQGLKGTGGVANMSGVSGNYNAPQFQGLDFSQLGQIGGQNPQFNMAQFLQGSGNAGLNRVNTQTPNIFAGQGNAGLNQQGLNLPQFQGTNLNQNAGGANLPGIQFNPAQFNSIGFQNGQMGAGGLDPNGQFSQALQQIAGNQFNKALADTRERYTGQSRTPAGFAEAALRAQMQPQIISQLSQANQQERGLNLQQMGLSNEATNQINQLRQQQNLAGNQFNQTNTQLGLNAQGINTGNILQNQGLQNQGALGLNNQFLQQSQNQNQFGLAGAGLQQGQQQMLNQQLLSQMGLSNEAVNALNQGNLQGFGMQQQGQQMNNQNQLQQLGLSNDMINRLNSLNLNQAQGANQFNLQNAGLQQQAQGQNVQNQLAQMQQMLGQNQFANQFGGQQAQFGANLGQQAQFGNIANMLQNQGMMNQFGLGVGGLGLQNQGQQLQGQMESLNRLFGGYQQAYGAGTPQAQTVQTPSMFSQITGGLANLGQAAAPFFGGGGFNFGGGAPNVMMGGNPYQSMPQGSGIGFTPQMAQQFQMPNVNQQQFPSLFGSK